MRAASLGAGPADEDRAAPGEPGQTAEQIGGRQGTGLDGPAGRCNAAALRRFGLAYDPGTRTYRFL